MSEGKWLIFGGHIIDKLEEVKKGLETDIQVEQYREKIEDDKDTRYGKVYPYQCVVSEINELLVGHMKDYVSTDECFFEDEEPYSIRIDRFPSHWRTLIGEPYIKEQDEQHKRRMIEWKRMEKLELEGKPLPTIEEYRKNTRGDKGTPSHPQEGS